MGRPGKRPAVADVTPLRGGAGVRAGFALLVLCCGLGLTLSLHRCVHAWEDKSLQAQVAARAQERARLLESKVLRSMEVLHSVTALFATHEAVSRDDFRVFVRHALAQQPEVQALGWSPRVVGADRARFEAAARREGFGSFHITGRDQAGRLVEASRREEYFPVYFIEPVQTNELALGFDPGSDAIRGEAMRRSRVSGAPAATAPLRLVQGGAGDSDDLGFIVYLPLIRDVGAREPSEAGEGWPGQGRPAGYASAVFRAEGLLKGCVADLGPQGLELSVVDTAPGGGPVFGAAPPARRGVRAGDAYAVAGGWGGGLAGSASLDVAGRTWTLYLRAGPSFVAANRGAQSQVILVTGLLITLLLTGYLYNGLSRTAEIERRVVERTAQLSNEVAERKRAEESARLAEAKYRSIFENSVEGIFQTTPDGRYISANRSLAEIYGYDSIEGLISDLTNIEGQLYVDPARRQQFIRQVQRSGHVSEFESQVYRRDGGVVWISETARAVRGAGGEVLYYEGTVADVTERKRAEDVLRRNRDELEGRVRERTRELAEMNAALRAEVAERKRAEEAADAASRAKSTFLANMSHEIRTPMNAILGYAQILHRDPALGGRQREALGTILSSGNHLMGLINDVLDLSKIEAGRAELHPAEFDLRELLRDLAAMFRQRCDQKGLALRVEAPGDGGTAATPGTDRSAGPRVVGDARKLRQVLINLLGNAVKFTDAGSVTVRVSAEAPPDRMGEGRVRVFRFEVADSGPGIDAAACARIFEPFQQAHPGSSRSGTGLGLTIAREQIELMGGSLAVESVPGAGSLFHFSLPLSVVGASVPPQAPDVPEAASPREIARLAPGESVRAMVVDDVRENRQVLAEMLKIVGCEVVTAEGGAKALEHLSATGRPRPDVIFIDMMMPGMDGPETARRIRSAPAAGGAGGAGGATPRLVATSASALAHQQEAYAAAGFDDFIAKPLRAERVYLCLASLLGVRYEHRNAPAGARSGDGPAEDAQPAGAPADLGLPRGLRDRVLAAAERYSITELKGCLSEIDALGPSARRASDSLRRYVRSYDMNGILTALGRASCEPPDSASLGHPAPTAQPSNA